MSIRTFSSLLITLSLFATNAACGVKPTPVSPPPITAPTITPPDPTLAPTPDFEPYTLPLSDFGDLFIGKRTFDFVDDSRVGRQVGITIWYPAIKPDDFTGTSLIDAQPDLAGAPYAVILSSTKNASYFGSHLVTRGFVIISVNRIGTYMHWDENRVDQPLDLLFALDQVRSNPPQGLEGLFDFEHVGAMGYSFDGYNALAMSGARIDPEHYLLACSSKPADEASIFTLTRPVQCPLADTWNAFSAHAGQSLTASADGLWQPMTDPGIRAVMPLAPDGWRLFGERGMAAADRAVMILVAENDEIYPEDILIYENLGTPDRYLISIAGKDHMMIFDYSYVLRMKHFAAAFFGVYLQGRQDYDQYFSQDFVESYPDLHWGAPSDE